MQKHMLAIVLIFCGAVWPASPADNYPKYQQVAAQLVRPRDGLGNVFDKLKQGQEVRIAYFGGSITAQNGWRPKTLKWFQQTFPQAKVSEINAAIGGTGSDLGVFRFQQDVLRHKPDLIFVEFSVNDGGAAPENIWRAMEGIIRQAWRQDPSIDICYVYTCVTNYRNDLDRGLCPRAASADEQLADHYGIPSINMAMRIAELARQGKLIFQPRIDSVTKAEKPTSAGVILFSKDGVHPLDAGHEVYLEVIAAALKEIAANSKPAPHVLKEPFVPDNWEKAKLVPLEPQMLSAGWRKMDPKQGLGKSFGNRMPEIWEATKPGERISFKFKGTAVMLYDLLGPDGGQVVCTVDGKSGKPIPRFDHYCTYHRLAHLVVGRDLEDKVHTVAVEIHPDQPDRSSVTDIEKKKPGFNPKKYEGTCFRVGGIMLLGESVK